MAVLNVIELSISFSVHTGQQRLRNYFEEKNQQIESKKHRESDDNGSQKRTHY